MTVSNISVGEMAQRAKDACEGCRLSWKLRGKRHGEPKPMECKAVEIRRQLSNLRAWQVR